jgi:VWFA-related protein
MNPDITPPGNLRSGLFGAAFALGIAGFALSVFSNVPLRAQQDAQQANKDTTFSTDVNVVNIFATVRDKQNKIVNAMAKDDFTLSEDGHPQVIRYFSQESDLPLTLGLLVDTSLSQRRVLEQEKDASYRFLDQVLRPEKDLTFVIHFDHDTELLQDLTSSRTDLRRSLDKVRLPDDARPQMRQAGQGYPNGNPNGNGGNGRQAGTTLYDAIFLASDEIMRKQHGRKALILLTDGVDEGSKTSLYECIKAAERSDTLVYSILFSDRESTGQQALMTMAGMGMGGRRGGGRGAPVAARQPDGKKILQQISRETGGGFFEVSKKESIDDIYKSIQEELRNQYSIGYVSDQGASGSSFRRITLTARKSGVIVQAPEGYYPATQ